MCDFSFARCSRRAASSACAAFSRSAATSRFRRMDDRTLSSILDQTAIAIDRAQLMEHSIRAAALEENEKLRTTLLSSLSHDLRTPLASITGAVTSLRELGDENVGAGPAGFARLDRGGGGPALALRQESPLDMSRIEAGALEVRRDWVDVADAVRGAAQRARKAFAEMKIAISVAPNLPFIRADANSTAAGSVQSPGQCA